MSKKKGNIHYAWIILIGLCIMVGLGKSAISSSAGLFLTPVANDLNIGLGNLMLYFSISSVVTMIFLPFGGKLMAKYNIRLILIIAIVLQAGAFALFGLMNSVWGWYILSIPLAVGGVFITVIAGPVMINQWFKKKNGLALGIMGASVGAIGAILQPVIGNMIAGQGWRFSYIAVGVGVIIIAVPVILLIMRKSPQEKGLQPYGSKEDKDAVDNAQSTTENAGISMAVAKKSSAFYALITFFFFVTSIGSFSLHIPTFLSSKGYDVAFAGNVMGAYMIGALAGALILGFLSDKIGSKNTTILAMVLGLISISSILLFSANSVIITIAIVLLGFVVASIGTLGPALTTSLFGSKEYSQIYSTASLGLAIASVVALPAYGYIYDFVGSYNPALYALMVMMVLNIICVTLAFKGKKKLVDQGHWK
ncbi:MFS transporter [Psychrobacillus sp. L3]|uniref:MFS transporter n=1 Tax=Psychrobacillus sp. L3 TaxID=3236891 RepID=UPI0036F28D59